MNVVVIAQYYTASKKRKRAREKNSLGNSSQVDQACSYQKPTDTFYVAKFSVAMVVVDN